MKSKLLSLIVAGLFTGCSSGPQSDFDKAGLAIYESNTSALAAVLAHNKGVVTNVSGFDGATLLHYSLANTPDIDCSELLVKAGADVNKPDRTGAAPLHIACKHGAKPEAISFLIKHGANLNMKDGQGRTPLQIAMRFGFWHSPEGVALLQGAGAKE